MTDALASDPGAPPDRRDFSVTIRRQRTTVVVSLEGVVDPARGCELEHLLFDLIIDKGNRDLLVDLSGVAVLDGSTLDLVLRAASATRERSGRLLVAGATTHTGEDPGRGTNGVPPVRAR